MKYFFYCNLYLIQVRDNKVNKKFGEIEFTFILQYPEPITVYNNNKDLSFFLHIYHLFKCKCKQTHFYSFSNVHMNININS